MSAVGQANASNPAVKRIMREYAEFQQSYAQHRKQTAASSSSSCSSASPLPSLDFVAAPLEDNLFEWHFTLRGPSSTPYSSGLYHGRILLPSNYPFRPPDVVLLTPSGRFECHKKICLSISSFHPANWQPSWSIRTVLTALMAFFPTPAAGAIGSLEYTDAEKRALAAKSGAYTCPHCKRSNADIIARHEKAAREEEEEEEEDEDGESAGLQPLHDASTTVPVVEASIPAPSSPSPLPSSSSSSAPPSLPTSPSVPPPSSAQLRWASATVPTASSSHSTSTPSSRSSTFPLSPSPVPSARSALTGLPVPFPSSPAPPLSVVADGVASAPSTLPVAVAAALTAVSPATAAPSSTSTSSSPASAVSSSSSSAVAVSSSPSAAPVSVSKVSRLTVFLSLLIALLLLRKLVAHLLHHQQQQQQHGIQLSHR